MAPLATEDTPLISKSNDAGDAAKFRELQQRWFMRSKTGSWTALLLCCLIQCFVALAPLGWQTLQQNMLDEGIPYSNSQLDEMENWGSGLALATFLPAGIVFDHYGPWIVGVGGVFLGGMSICGMAVALMSPDYLYWLLGPAYVLNYIFYYTSNLCLYSYLWILNEKRFAVSAIFQSNKCLAVSGVYLSVWLTNSYGVTTGSFFMGLGLLCCASTTILWFALPTNGEANLLKKYSLSIMACEGEEKPSIDDIFGAGESGEQDEDEHNNIVYQKLWDVACIAFLQHPGEVWLYVANTYVLYMSCATLSINQYAYYLCMFSEETAIYLVDFSPIMSGFVGPILAVSLGILYEKSGIELAIVCSNYMNIVFLILNAIPSEGSIIASMVMWAGAKASYRIIGPVFDLLYAPPELVGTLAGCICFTLGIGQLVITQTLSVITLDIFSSHSYWRYGTQFLIWGVGVLLTGSLMVYWFKFKHHFKRPGVASYLELRKFQSQTATK